MDHFNEEIQLEQHKCDQCNFDSYIKVNLTEHHKNKHVLALNLNQEDVFFNNQFQCRYCSLATNSLLFYIGHQCTSTVLVCCEPQLLEPPPPPPPQEDADEFCIEDAITVYACLKCSYKSKDKSDLTRHEASQHAPPAPPVDETDWFYCTLCSYRAKQKRTVRQHVLTHTAPEQIVYFDCPSCPYTSKQKSHLKQHMLMHLVPDSITWYNCTKCSYQSKYKAGLKRHEILMHVLAPPAPETAENVAKSEASERHRLDCSHCSYRAMKPSHLREHMLKHAAPEDIKWFCCPQCTYRGKQKKHLKQHMMQHAGYEEIKWYDCDQCSYQTKFKSHLTLHMLQHAPPEEITWFACKECPFKTMRECSLKCHVLTQHQNVAVVVPEASN